MCIDNYKIEPELYNKYANTVVGTHILLQDNTHLDTSNKKKKKSTYGRILDSSLEMLNKRLGFGKKKKSKAVAKQA